MEILHVLYDVELAPALDIYIFEAMCHQFDDMDCMRDEQFRELYFYFKEAEDLDLSRALLIKNGRKQLRDAKEECCLLDFIKIANYEKDEYFDEKLLMKKRISEIYQRSQRLKDGQIKSEQKERSSTEIQRNQSTSETNEE